jgi:hypothetical protein
LHRDLLIDKTFMRLPTASKALAPLLWLLASESVDGIFDADFDQLEFRLRFTEKELMVGLKPLIENGFFIDATTMLAVRLQDAIPETETEADKRQIFVPPIPSELLHEWLVVRKKKPVTERVFNSVIKEANKIGWTPEQAIVKCCERGWTGFESSWIEKTEVKSVWTPKGNQL